MLFDEELTNNVKPYFTQEIFDYNIDNYTSIEYPAKRCTLEDFTKFDKKADEPRRKDADTLEDLFNTWKGYTIFCPDIPLERDEIKLSGHRGSMVSKHMQFNVRMCNQSDNKNCEIDQKIREYVKDLQVDTWIINEVIDFTNLEGRPTFPIQKLLFS